MIVEIYGKQECEICKSAARKIAHFLKQWAVEDEVTVTFMDVETERGAAESDFFDVFEIPSVLLKSDADDVVARWDGQAPPSGELRTHLCA